MIIIIILHRTYQLYSLFSCNAYCVSKGNSCTMMVWTFELLQDHINFTLGRQSFNLRLLEDAQIFFRQLLEYESLQEPEQQASYLREFLFVFKVSSLYPSPLNPFYFTSSS